VKDNLVLAMNGLLLDTQQTEHSALKAAFLTPDFQVHTGRTQQISQ
jgi:hypothetical protein